MSASGSQRFDRLRGQALGGRLEARDIGQGVTQIRLSSRLTRSLVFETTPYLLDDILVDTGYPHVSGLVFAYLESRPIRSICLTHHHEDHVGCCARLAASHGCPVYLSDPEAAWSEGVAGMLPYRRVYWGSPEPYQPVETPEVVRSEKRTLRVVPTPGHSRTHVAFFEEATGLLLSGDLYVSGAAAAVMTQENPYESVRSLRRAAGLDPSRMLTGHGLVLERPAPALRAKADRIESAASAAVELWQRGIDQAEIVRRVFDSGHLRDRVTTWLTAGEFSRRNFVRACIAYRPHAD